jgi:hypothetical protein
MNPDELHDLVMLLKNGVAFGEIKIPEGSPTRKSLDRVRLNADGKVDPNTVDSSVRAAARAAAGAKATREMRKIPLRDVQAAYFDILDQFFGKSFSEMKAHGVTPAQAAEHLASQKAIVGAFEAELEEFASGMHEFWEYYAPVVELHLRELKCLKSVFGGDVFPSYSANIACSVGLYMDTIVLPDPLMRILSMAKNTAPRECCRLVTKHALSALGYRDLALADVDPPIVVIAADPMFLNTSYLTALEATSNEDVVKHASTMFGCTFPTIEALQSFLGQFVTAEKLVTKLADPTRLLFDSDWSEPLPEQFARYVQDTASWFPDTVGASVAETIYRAFFGRMMQTNDLLFRSAEYIGTPLIDAPTSWQYLLWKYEYDSAHSGLSRKEMPEIVISKAIATEGGTEFAMLSGVPPQSLIELRRTGAMASLRETIRNGLKDIDLASPDSLPRVADEVIAIIDRKFEEHDRELKGIISSRRRFFGQDVSRCVVGGGLTIAAALTKTLNLAILAAAARFTVGAPSISDLHKQHRTLQARSKELQRSPAAILFRHLGHKFGFSS